jgi:cytochrome P450
MAPVFTPRNVHGFAASMRKTAEAFAETLKPGKALLAPAMSELTYRVLSEALFSGEISGDTEAILADVALFLEMLGHPDPLDVLRVPAWVPRPTKLRGRSSMKRLRNRVRALIEAREKRLEAGETLPRDFATLLLEAGRGTENAFSHDEIEDHLITFIGAGHETTARGLAWTLYLLANDPVSRTRIEAEIDALDMDHIAEQDWLDALPFTRACFEEAMRLYPPAAAIARVAIREDNCNGVVVPAGSTVLVNTWILHRHHLLWERPDSFDPERFMAPVRDRIDRFAYLPFGLGPHICIGASFAMQEAAILLAVLIRRFRFDYAGDKPPWPVMRITVQPDNGMPMTITAR